MASTPQSRHARPPRSKPSKLMLRRSNTPGSINSQTLPFSLFSSFHLSLFLQFSTQYRIVPKSESVRLWHPFLPMRQIFANIRTTGHDPCSFLFRLEGTKLRSNVELLIDCVIFNCGIPRDLNLDKQKYVWEVDKDHSKEPQGSGPFLY